MSSTAAAPLADLANKMKGSSRPDDMLNYLLRYDTELNKDIL